MAALVVAAGPVAADTLYWDTNGATTGSGNATAGTWDASTTANWTLNSAGTAATQTFGTNNTAVFSAGTDNVATTTVTVSGTVNPNGITFESELTNLTVTGGTIDFGSTQGAINSSALGTTGTKVAVIASNLTGTAGLTISGHGNLSSTGGSSSALFRLSGNNVGLSGGINVTGGLVAFPNQDAAGSNTITLSNFGGILDTNVNLQLTNNIVVQSTGGTFRVYGTSATTNYSGSITGTGNINRTDGGTLTLSGSGAGYSGTYNNQAGTTVFTATDWQNAKFDSSAGTLTFAPSSSGATVQTNNVTAVGTVNINNNGVLDVTTGALKLRSTAASAVSRAASTTGQLTSSSGTLTITSVDGGGVTTTGSLGTNTHTFGINIVDPAGGALAIVKNGVNDTAFSQANTYTGGTTINAGRITGSNATAYGTGAVTINSGGQAFLSVAGPFANAFTINGTGQLESAGTLGALRLGGATVNGAVTLAGNSRINAHGSTGTLTGGIGQTGGPRNLEFGGSSSAGTITLTTTAATYTGSTAINNATVNVGTQAAPAASNLLASTSAVSLGAVAGTGNGVLNLNVAGSYTYATPTTIGTAASQVSFFSPNATDVVTVGTPLGTDSSLGILTVNGPQLKFGSGASAAVAQIQVGNNPVNVATSAVGTVVVEPGASLTTQFFNIGQAATGTAGNVAQTGGTVTIAAGNNNGGFRLGHWNSSAVTAGNNYSLTGGTLDATGLSTNTTASAQVVNVGWDGLATFTVGGGAGTATLKAYGVQIDANGDTTAYANRLIVASNGVVEIGGGGVAGASTSDKVVLNGGGTLRATASGTWSAAFDATAGGTTTFDANAGATATLSGAWTGPGTIAKTGPGTLLVTTAVAGGGGVTVTGGSLASAVNVGSLAVGAAGTVRPGASAVDGVVGTTSAATFDLAAGGTLRMDLNGTTTTAGGTTNDLVAATGAATINGGTIVPVFNGPVTGGNVYTLVTSSGITVGTVPTVDAAVAGNSRLSYAVGSTATNLTLTVTGTAKSLKWTGGTDGLWNTNASQNWQATAANDEKFFISDGVAFDAAGASTPTVSIPGSVSPAAVTVNATTDYTFAGVGSIDAGTLSKAGTGTLTLATNNAYAGATTVTGGRLAVGNGGTSGSLGTGSVALSTGTKLAFNRSDAQTVANVITGAGGVEHVGTGTTILTGASTYNGGTLIARGTVIARADGAFGAGPLTIGDVTTGGSPITVSIENRVDIPATVPVTVTANGTGPVVIASTSTGGTAPAKFLGTMTLNRPVTFRCTDTADRLSIEGKITGPVGTITIDGGSRTTFLSTASDFVGNVAITGTGTILQASVASAAETIPNASSVDVGTGATFQLAGTANSTETINALTGSGTVTRNVAGLQTLAIGSAGGSGSFSGPINNGSGSVGITKVGGGTLSLSGVNVYTGATTVTGGTLLADTTGATNSATGTGAVTVSTAGTLGGSGRIAGTVTVDTGGRLAPGAVWTLGGPVGTLTVANAVTFGAAGAAAAPAMDVKLRNTAGSSDVLALTGTTTAGLLSLSNADVLNLLPTEAITTSKTYTIATFAQLAGTFDAVTIGGQPTQSANPADPNYALVTYNATNIQVTVANAAAVPEPASAGLVALAGVGLLARRRRREARAV